MNNKKKIAFCVANANIEIKNTLPKPDSEFKCVIFDMDGTLVSSTKLAHKTTNSVLEHFGHPHITLKEYGEGTKYTTPARLAWHAGLDFDSKQGIEMGTLFDQRIITMVNAVDVPLFEGITEILQNLNLMGVRMAVLSNASGRYVRRVNEAHRLQTYFKVQWGADDAAEAKPNPDGLLQILETLKVDPKIDRSVYIGDSISDGKAAQAAGMYAIGVSWGENSKEVLEKSEAFDIVLDSVEELQKLLATGGAGN
eukprot:CAMPEP_0197520944 /NCGR_PEP_ID=MMETSP1318-20131121/6267_1 /TAXON_ID=552666 /ORGANISM="Partenskyella glossopodia, Strain RCC365" /LENGTH=252 /DNA_ID=CAMNT_0043072729 /DNA_START=387 /DNA_END=1145 /DNA_ORIENTATION=+